MKKQNSCFLELIELAKNARESDWELLVGCRKAEATPNRWRADFASFDAMLDAGIMRPARYRTWLVAVDLLGEETVKEIGADAAGVLVRKEPPQKVVDLAVQHFRSSREANHMPISKQQARNVVDRLDTRPKRSGYEMKNEQQARAADEVRTLKRRIIVLERENASLTEENARLRERLLLVDAQSGSRKGGARKPTAKHAD